MLATAVRDDPWCCARLAELPAHAQQPAMLLAVARVLGGGVPDSGADLIRFLHDNWSAVATELVARDVRTNDVGRCAALLPALGMLNGPIALLEVGACAGLCLRLDSYRYTSVGVDGLVTLGPPSAPVHIASERRGPLTLPTRMPDIVWRAGLDLAPVSLVDEREVAMLDALIAPEATERRERLAAAVAEARRDPPTVVAGDLVDDLVAVTAEAPRDARLVVLHAAVLPHADEAKRLPFVELVAALGAVRISMEIGRAVAELGIVASSPAVEAADRSAMWVCVDDELVATADPFGAWVAAP